jgi:hypothetical protein
MVAEPELIYQVIDKNRELATNPADGRSGNKTKY